MLLMLFAFLLLAITELLLYLPLFWQTRRITALAIAFGVAFYAGTLFPITINGWSILLLAVALYRCFNLMRVARGVGSPAYLHTSGLRTSVSLICMQCTVLVGFGSATAYSYSASAWWLFIAGLQLVVAITIYITTGTTSRRTVAAANAHGIPDHDLPSITVAIPARNETESLRNCLDSLVKNRYPKLEILVLDDCSQDRTSEIIKSYAHAGVRFIKGSAPSDDWLSKNWAYEQLYTESNGKIVIFAGADMTFSAEILRNLVTTMQYENLTMTCVLPNYPPPTKIVSIGALVQPIRHAWEVSLPRQLFKRPAVISSCWAVDRTVLKAAGGFGAVRRSICPESHFARYANARGQYRMLRSGEHFELLSSKTADEQVNTAIRTKYPQQHRRPEMVMLVTAVELILILGTVPLAIGGMLTGNWLTALTAIISYMLHTLAYHKVLQIAYGTASIYMALSMLPAACVDVIIRHVSMYRYEFSEVNWKGRNVCLPMMQVIPRLPKIT